LFYWLLITEHLFNPGAFVLRSKGGEHVLQYNARTQVEYYDVRPLLRQALVAQPPSSYG